MTPFFDFPPPPVPTCTATCPNCGWVSSAVATEKRAAYCLSQHRCLSARARRRLAEPSYRRTSADTAEDVEFILDYADPWTTPQALTDRLGYKDTGGLYIALRRAHRDDLLARLDRNARVAS